MTGALEGKKNHLNYQRKKIQINVSENPISLSQDR